MQVVFKAGAVVVSSSNGNLVQVLFLLIFLPSANSLALVKLCLFEDRQVEDRSCPPLEDFKECCIPSCAQPWLSWLLSTGRSSV